MRFDIIGIGHACLDYLGIVPYVPEIDGSVRMTAMERQGGGAVSQALVAASRLGARTAYAGVLGADEAGEYLKNDFIKEKVDISGLTMEPGGRTSTAFMVVERDTGKRTIYVYPGTISRLRINDKIKSLILSARYLHLDATTYDTALEAASFAKEHRIKVSLDGCEIEAQKEKTFELIKLTDILITNETYPRVLTGMNDPQQALLTLAAIGPEIVISTIGSKGCLLVQNGRVISFEAYPIKAVDTTGAGDVFHGAFLYGLLQHWEIETIIKFASATSAINCLSLGGRVGIPTRKQVVDFMAKF